MVFQAEASSAGSAQPGSVAEPGSLLRHHWAMSFSKVSLPFLRSATRWANCSTAVLKAGMVSSASALVQASAMVPPQQVWMRPMGTPSSLWRCRPK